MHVTPRLGLAKPESSESCSHQAEHHVDESGDSGPGGLTVGPGPARRRCPTIERWRVRVNLLLQQFNRNSMPWRLGIRVSDLDSQASR